MPDLFCVYCVNCIEYEKDQGPRPDGHTLHASLTIANDHIVSLTKGRGGHTPSIYSQPGTPFLIEVDEPTYRSVMTNGTIQGDPTRHRR